MHDPIGSVVLGSLSTLFAGYGFRELILAYKMDALPAWSEKAVPGAAGVIVAAVFVVLTLQTLG
jgi:hypothetical protein